jgi:glutathione synthase/RimK-type ligase-like ATP-grasp enzyme
MRIGIVGAKNELHTLHMFNILTNFYGVETLIIDTIDFPENATLSMIDEKVKYQREFIEDIKSFYIRSVFFSLPPYDLEDVKETKNVDFNNWYIEYIAERERQSLLTSWLRSAEIMGKFLVNPVECFDLHYLKPYQLSLLRKNNIPVPKTLVTNDPEELKKFKEEIKQVVYKPVAGGASCRLF